MKNSLLVFLFSDSDYQLVNGSNCDVGSKQSTLSNKFNLSSSGNITPNKQTDLYDSFKRMPPLGIQVGNQLLSSHTQKKHFAPLIFY